VAGASAIASPVFGADGAFLVGLGIAGPSDRMRARLPAMERALKDAARRLTAMVAGLKP
jgi:DNA-binding IclR family transcriptional regulator